MTLEQRIELARCHVEGHAVYLAKLANPPKHAHERVHQADARSQALRALDKLGQLLLQRERELARVRCSSCGALSLRGSVSACAGCGRPLPGQLALPRTATDAG